MIYFTIHGCYHGSPSGNPPRAPRGLFGVLGFHPSKACQILTFHYANYIVGLAPSKVLPHSIPSLCCSKYDQKMRTTQEKRGVW